MKVVHVLKAIGSGIIWGLGQLFNKQFIKALLFFAVFAGVIGLELGTGNYFNSEIDLYSTKISGEYFNNSSQRDTIAEGAFNTYLQQYVSSERLTTNEDIVAWNAFYSENGNDVTIDQIIEYIGTVIRTEYDNNYDYIIETAETAAIERATTASTDARALASLAADYAGFSEETFDKFKDALGVETYAEAIAQRAEKLYNETYATQIVTQTSTIYTRIMQNNEFLNAVDYVFEQLSNNVTYNFSASGWNEAIMRIYYAAYPEEYKALEETVYDATYEKAGFFIKGLWGLATLGTCEETTINEHIQSAKNIAFLLPSNVNESPEIIEGHNSINLMIQGVLAVILIIYIAIIYIWNVTDAYKSSKKLAAGEKQGQIQYFKDVYENSFEYIVLLPAFILMSFITLMPIVFSFLIAFTNYSFKFHNPPAQLLSWVGFENFVSLFGVAEGGINFGDTFWKILAWTLIWAVGATFTCFFGGFIQAVILNNKRVVFRKFWRTILILPWAIPAMVSQMMFRLFFDDSGIMNIFIEASGLKDVLVKTGFLGRTLVSVSNASATFFERVTYFGTDFVMWFSNSNSVNPWLPRIFIIVLNIWLGFPYFMAMMSGIMTSISKDLYEAAEIDGATAFDQFKKITMPLVLYSTAPLLIMSFSGNFNNFGVIYFITQGGPQVKNPDRAYAGDTDILISWIYTLTTGSNIGWYSMASVFSILIFLVVGSISTWNFLRTKSFQEEDMM